MGISDCGIAGGAGSPDRGRKEQQFEFTLPGSGKVVKFGYLGGGVTLRLEPCPESSATLF